MKIDFHIHTIFSKDSLNKPEDIMRICERKEILPVIADHNSIKAHKEFKGRIIPAEEVGTDEGDLIGLYVQDLIPKKTPFLETLDRIREQGGISYLPHMFDSTRAGIRKEELAKKVDIIEVFNGRSLRKKYNDMALEFAEKHNKLKAAGSDAHFLDEIGNAYVEMDDFDIGNPKELLKSLKKGKIHGRRSPVYMKGMTKGVILWKKFFS